LALFAYTTLFRSCRIGLVAGEPFGLRDHVHDGMLCRERVRGNSGARVRCRINGEVTGVAARTLLGVDMGRWDNFDDPVGRPGGRPGAFVQAVMVEGAEQRAVVDGCGTAGRKRTTLVDVATARCPIVWTYATYVVTAYIPVITG